MPHKTLGSPFRFFPTRAHAPLLPHSHPRAGSSPLVPTQRPSVFSLLLRALTHTEPTAVARAPLSPDSPVLSDLRAGKLQARPLLTSGLPVVSAGLLCRASQWGRNSKGAPDTTRRDLGSSLFSSLGTLCLLRRGPGFCIAESHPLVLLSCLGERLGDWDGGHSRCPQPPGSPHSFPEAWRPVSTDPKTTRMVGLPVQNISRSESNILWDREGAGRSLSVRAAIC